MIAPFKFKEHQTICILGCLWSRYVLYDCISAGSNEEECTHFKWDPDQDALDKMTAELSARKFISYSLETTSILQY